MTADWLNSLTERKRQKVFAVMREIAMEATQNAYAAVDGARRLDPDACRLRLLANGAEAFLESIRRGSTSDQAALVAMNETAMVALKFNMDVRSGGPHQAVPHQYITDCLNRVNRAKEGVTT